MSDRTVQAGEIASLRALFKDDTNDPVQATSVYVHIFEPGQDTSDLSNALTVSGVPDYLGGGIFEYNYTTPTTAVAGVWHDVWEGSLPSQDITAELAFTVFDSGTISTLEHQLHANNEVEITIPSGVRSISGDSFLEEDYTFQFLTVTDPSYTNIRKVRLEIGGFLDGISDITLQTNILEASLEADVLTFATSQTNTALYQHARRQYVTCLASSITLGNLNNYLLKSKTLADLSVTYDTNGLRDAMNALKDCLDKWEPQLLAGGGAKAASNPSMVIKGALDPDRITSARMWAKTDDFDNTPAANTRLRDSGHRRYLRTFRKNKKWW